MAKRLCAAITFCLLACLGLRAEGIRHDVIHDKVVLISHVPVAQEVYAVTDSLPHRKHRLVAALLAFPLGIFGLHRMYLGTSTATPLIYIATIGGAFGVLPFIDCVLILLCKDVNKYAHNPRLFMWSRK